MTRMYVMLFLACSLAAENKKAVKLFNEYLGKTRAEVMDAWGRPTDGTVGESGPSSLIWQMKPRTLFDPGSAPKSTTRTRGHLDDYGNWTGTSTTETVPGRESKTFVITDRLTNFFDENGRARRWEFYDWVTTADLYKNNAPPVWRLRDAREIVYKNGKPKIITPGKFKGIMEY